MFSLQGVHSVLCFHFTNCQGSISPEIVSLRSYSPANMLRTIDSVQANQKKLSF